MALEPAVPLRMGPERICPNEHEELGLQETADGTPDPAGEWSSEAPEEEEEQGGSNGYLYQPLNQDPDQGAAAAAAEEVAAPSPEPVFDIIERLQVVVCFLMGYSLGFFRKAKRERALGKNVFLFFLSQLKGVMVLCIIYVQAMRLHLPDPPVDSEDDDDDEGPAVQSSQSSIPMDPGNDKTWNSLIFLGPCL